LKLLYYDYASACLGQDFAPSLDLTDICMYQSLYAKYVYVFSRFLA
jgi:hypothetical protein